MILGNAKLENRNSKIEGRSPNIPARLSSFQFPIWKCFAGLVATVSSLSAASAAYAQGCAMCYTSAAAAKAGALQALRSGILILLVPVVLMCGAIAVVIFRRRNQFNEYVDWTEEHDREWRDLLVRMGPVEQHDVDGHEVESHSPVS